MAAPSPEPGLRERKKRQTRELIAMTARRLFARHGFEGVPISAIARAAEVSEQTVFNYFPTKEDLVYWRLEDFEGELLAAIRGRPDGVSIIRAFGDYVMRQRGLLAEQDPKARKALEEVTRMITESPALLARERAIFEGYTGSLAALVADEVGSKEGDVSPWVIANALIGVHRALIDYTRRGIVVGTSPVRLRREVRAQGGRAIATLETGLGAVGVR